ncbi:MAG: glycosyl transferase family 2 [Nocardioides sp.]|nr:glycosyl transferase family 2 [Nocardioides sp.]
MTGTREPRSRPQRVLIIVPAWNEQDALTQTLQDIASSGEAVHVLVVDDGSTDSTATVAADAGALVCSLPFNLGVGGAMRTGYRYALRHGYDAAVQFDADGQHDARYLSPLIDQLVDHDLVIGARFAGEGVPYRVSPARRAAMKILAVALSRMARTTLTDVTSGYRAANARAMRVFAAHYPAEYLGDTVESTVIAVRAGCQIGQYPVEMRVRQGGVPSQTSARALLYLVRAGVALVLALVRRWPAVDEDDAVEPTVPTAHQARTPHRRHDEPRGEQP